ncbi:MAG: M3 family oligoendopeptidase [Trueperaceae bacterium]
MSSRSVPGNPPASDWETFEPRYAALLREDLTPDQIPSWLTSWSELEKDVGEAHASLKRAADEDTADERAREALLSFVHDVSPRVSVANQKLKALLLAVEGFVPKPEESRMIERLRNEADLFREENVEVLTEIETLSNDFYTITGAIVVRLDGDEFTIPQVLPRLYSPERAERERAWRAIVAGKLEKAAELDALFLRLLELRRRLAVNAGLPDFRDFQWRAMNRFDYGPDDSQRLDDAIAAEAVPLLGKLYDRRRQKLGVDELRPWDRDVDLESRQALRPFDTVEELEEGLERVFTRLDPVLGQQFHLLRDGWMDLEARKGKVPGLGYQMEFPRSGRPYIYHSLAGLHDDVVVLLHEAGHAFHSLARSGPNQLIWNRHPGPEFAEVASQAMELLPLPYLSRAEGGFYSEEGASRARNDQLERILRLLPHMAKGDLFQHWLYTQDPGELSIDEIDAKWLELDERFEPGVDWSGLEREHAKGWQFFHIFCIPFYLLDYAIAYLGAIQVWRNSLNDPEAALSSYREALALGASRALPELFAATGADFSFEGDHVGELARFVYEQMDR